ncbi:response regulator transcription factor [Granulosicoccus sp.]|nr:response regulator transcription factor [Granulosicoccus sp.]MDB4223081.1 response regulator transcription factor [Granulosicoccus sp.]
MSRGNINNLVGDGIGLNRASNDDSVFVISDCETDAEHVSSLLSQSGYNSEWLADFSTLSKVKNKSTLTKQYLATVVCHRKSTACHLMSLSQHLPGNKIIVLSDCESEQTVVSLLNSGAHHFFNLSESDAVLQVRLEAALRLNQKFTNNSFAVGDIYFNAEKRIVTRQGEVVDLSPKEFDLAYYLFINRDRMVVNSELMTLVWSLPAKMDTRRIDTAACRLRKKLKLNSENGWQLKRLRTIGYRLIPVEIKSHSETPFDQPLRIASA